MDSAIAGIIELCGGCGGCGGCGSSSNFLQWLLIVIPNMKSLNKDKVVFSQVTQEKVAFHNKFL